MSGSPIRFLDVPAMVAEAPPTVPWLAPPVLPRAALTVLYAPGGDGKSLFSMALAAAVAGGGELAGIGCERGSAVYLDAENGEHEIHRRVHTLALPPVGVRVADASRLDLRRHMAELEALVREMSPDLLVLDSFRSLTPGMEENATDQTARALDPLRRLAHESGTAILLIHHTNKAGKEYRGASSIRDGVDVLWHLGRQDGDPDPQRRFLHNVKMRVAPDGERLWLRLNVDRGCVLIDPAEPPNEQTSPIAQPVRARLSDAILAGIGDQPMNLASIAEMVGRRPKDGSVRNTLAALEREGLLSHESRGYVKVQTVQTDTLHRCTTPDDAVQGATPLKGAAPLHPLDHSFDADDELARLTEKFGEEAE
ncbi:MAG TPA: AAA family ATPase [Solirubrobacteraceae bacterium]|nr:AAA family ATPase [Solirubrobacteraceae bacterium]